MPPELEGQPLDDWPTGYRQSFWRLVLRAPEMAPERGFPVVLAVIPLTRMLRAYEAGKWTDDGEPE